LLIENCILLTSKIICVAILIDTFEILYKKEAYSKDGLFSFSLLFHKKRYNFLQRFFLNKFFIQTTFIRLILSIFGLIVFSPIIFIPLLFFQVISFIRNKSANSASDQMLIIVLYGFTVYSLNISDFVNQCCLFFIAIQATVSYVTAGYHKLFSSVWRDGSAILMVMGTDSYGYIPFYTFLINNKKFSLVLAWATILFDFFFFVALGFPIVAIIFSVLGILFHAANAYFMGLNMFLFVFVSTYPCVYFTSVKLSEYLLQ